MRTRFKIPESWPYKRTKTAKGTLFVYTPPKQGVPYRLCISDVQLLRRPNAPAPDKVPADEIICRGGEDPLSMMKILSKLRQSSPSAYIPEFAIMAVVGDLIKRDQCPYSLSLSPWPVNTRPGAIEDSSGKYAVSPMGQKRQDGEQIDMAKCAVSALYAVPETGEGVWIVTAFELHDQGGTAEEQVLAGVQQLQAGQQEIKGTTSGIQAGIEHLVHRKKIAARAARGRRNKGGRPRCREWERADEIREVFNKLRAMYADEPAMQATIDELGLDCGTRTLRKIVHGQR